MTDIIAIMMTCSVITMILQEIIQQSHDNNFKTCDTNVTKAHLPVLPCALSLDILLSNTQK